MIQDSAPFISNDFRHDVLDAPPSRGMTA